MKQPAFNLIKACLGDVPELAAMNKCLIDDECSDNPMTLPELEQRMAGFLQGEFQGVLIHVDGKTAGYCLFRPEEGSYGGKPGIYLRQYIIKPEYRQHGLGRAALKHIIETCFTDAAFVTLDVLECNEVGKAFWANVGFKPIYHRLKLDISE